MFLAPRSMFAAFGKAESGDATLFEQGILFLATVLTLDKSRKSECGSRNGTGPSATSWPTIVSNLRRDALFLPNSLNFFGLREWVGLLQQFPLWLSRKAAPLSADNFLLSADFLPQGFREKGADNSHAYA